MIIYENEQGERSQSQILSRAINSFLQKKREKDNVYYIKYIPGDAVIRTFKVENGKRVQIGTDSALAYYDEITRMAVKNKIA